MDDFTLKQTASFVKDCAYCGNPFETKHAKKKYCSSTCKTYNSLEKSGKLSASSMARKKNETIGEIRTQEKSIDERETLIDNLMQSYLESLFSTDGEFYFTHPTDENEMPVYFDVMSNIERVKRTSSGNYIITSSSKSTILELKTKFKGSEIFEGRTESTFDHTMMNPYETWISMGRSQIQLEENNYQRPPLVGREEFFKTYSTLLTRENIIRVAKIPVDLI